MAAKPSLKYLNEISKNGFELNVLKTGLCKYICNGNFELAAFIVTEIMHFADFTDNRKWQVLKSFVHSLMNIALEHVGSSYKLVEYMTPTVMGCLRTIDQKDAESFKEYVVDIFSIVKMMCILPKIKLCSHIKTLASTVFTIDPDVFKFLASENLETLDVLIELEGCVARCDKDSNLYLSELGQSKNVLKKMCLALYSWLSLKSGDKRSIFDRSLHTSKKITALEWSAVTKDSWSILIFTMIHEASLMGSDEVQFHQLTEDEAINAVAVASDAVKSRLADGKRPFDDFIYSDDSSINIPAKHPFPFIEELCSFYAEKTITVPPLEIIFSGRLSPSKKPMLSSSSSALDVKKLLAVEAPAKTSKLKRGFATKIETKLTKDEYVDASPADLSSIHEDQIFAKYANLSKSDTAYVGANRELGVVIVHGPYDSSFCGDAVSSITRWCAKNDIPTYEALQIEMVQKDDDVRKRFVVLSDVYQIADANMPERTNGVLSVPHELPPDWIPTTDREMYDFILFGIVLYCMGIKNITPRDMVSVDGRLYPGKYVAKEFHEIKYPFGRVGDKLFELIRNFVNINMTKIIKTVKSWSAMPYVHAENFRKNIVSKQVNILENNAKQE